MNIDDNGKDDKGGEKEFRATRKAGSEVSGFSSSVQLFSFSVWFVFLRQAAIICLGQCGSIFQGVQFAFVPCAAEYRLQYFLHIKVVANLSA